MQSRQTLQPTSPVDILIPCAMARIALLIALLSPSPPKRLTRRDEYMCVSVLAHTTYGDCWHGQSFSSANHWLFAVPADQNWRALKSLGVVAPVTSAMPGRISSLHLVSPLQGNFGAPFFDLVTSK
jgi:hypothetical protein